MKILIVEDEPSVRNVLRRIVTQLQCEAVVAEDGLRGLMAIAEEQPDLVLLDVRMPVLDGLAVLLAIRTSDTHRDLPVIAISGVADREQVRSLVNLGISDYLLKPFELDTVIRRVTRVAARVVERRPGGTRPPGLAVARPRLLLIDRDPNFRTFARPLLESQFEVLEAESGSQGMQLFLDRRPSLVLVAEGLPLLTERLVARSIRELPADSGRPQVYLVSERSTMTAEDREVFAGVIRRTFVPDHFVAEVAKLDHTSRDVVEHILSVLNRSVRDDLVSAARQTLGVMTSSELRELDPAELGACEPEVLASVDLIERETSVRLFVGLYGGVATVQALGAQILGAPVSLAEASEAFAEMVNTVGGRMRHCLHSQGVFVEQGASHLADRATLGKLAVAVPLQSEAGHRVVVAMWAERGAA